MILSDRSIRKEIRSGRLKLSPYDPKSVQPASYDVKLGDEFRIFKNIHKPYLDVKEDMKGFMELVRVKKGDPIILHPREFVLGTTIEKITLPADLMCQLNGRSSLGRLGIIIHATAGFVDPGFSGHITLEMSNMANIPIALYPGMRIGQFSFMRLDFPAESIYGKQRGSKYYGQKGPTASRLYEDF